MKYKIYDGVVIINKEKMVESLHKRRHECVEQMIEDINYNVTEPGWCSRAWDDMTCWPPSAPNQTHELPCPTYVHMSKVKEKATRFCDENGVWYYHTGLNRSWTNYSMCFGEEKPQNKDGVPKLLQDHLENISTMYVIGYSTSLLTLLVALFIMIYFKKLHCTRNIVHINLFLSLILRAFISILRELLFVNGLGFQKDMRDDGYGNAIFIEEGPHWECKLVISLFHYALCANYMWIAMEGLYLHTLIFVTVFSEKSRIHYYVIFGWISPLVIILAWVTCRITLENTYCWNTWNESIYSWIIQAPIAITNIVNFVFFCNIVRMLVTKLDAAHAHEDRKFRKLAKSTMVLIPLFGVPYILFLSVQRIDENILEVVKLYFELFVSSFQGILVAILFCFMNGEVKSELRKWWRRMRTRRGHFSRGGSQCHHSTMNTSITYVRNGGPGPIINAEELTQQTESNNVNTVTTQISSDNHTVNNGHVIDIKIDIKPQTEEEMSLLNKQQHLQLQDVEINCNEKTSCNLAQNEILPRDHHHNCVKSRDIIGTSNNDVMKNSKDDVDDVSNRDVVRQDGRYSYNQLSPISADDQPLIGAMTSSNNTTSGL